VSLSFAWLEEFFNRVGVGLAFVKMTAAESIREQDMKTLCPISREKEFT
jgi:hypothetical protein